jgi:hypothetical protein
MDPLTSDVMSNAPEKTRESVAAKAPPDSLPGPRGSTAETAGVKPANQLTPEEQMALFEKELKETDWGHQPC